MQLSHLLALILLLAFCASASAEVPLVVNGDPRAIVGIPDEPTPIEQYAAEEFVLHIAKATGVGLPVFGASAAPAEPAARVLIGHLPEAEAAGIALDALDEEAAVVRPAGARLIIVGEDTAGDPHEENPREGTHSGLSQ